MYRLRELNRNTNTEQMAKLTRLGKLLGALFRDILMTRLTTPSLIII